MTLRILLVEDDPELAEAIATVLRSHRHVVDPCGEGLEAWALLRSDLASYGLVIDDWMLPGISGVELCRRLRAAGVALPVLMLTALGDTRHRVQGLDAGAEDYLGKPFAMEELLARVRALQRRQPSFREPMLQHGAYALAPTDGRLTVSTSEGPVRIELSGKEQQLMVYFLEHPEQIISGARLRAQLWDLDADPISNVVAAQVRLLRRKIAGHGLPCPIETVPARGYRFHPPPCDPAS